MHSLHRILVDLTECMTLKGNPTKEDMEDAARHRAEYNTENYLGRVFDWRTTDTAGRWVHMYPDNVILSKYDYDKVIRELDICQENQKAMINNCLDDLKEFSLDVSVLADMNKRGSPFPSYSLLSLSELLSGEYTFDSGFYDTSRDWSSINEETFNEIKERPNDWAIVLFDYHY